MTNDKIASAELFFDERNVPISSHFDDPYFSFHNGLEESRYVFLQGNQLPERLVDGFQIAEIGFGTGLNFFALMQAWQGKGQIKFTSFEAFPVSPDDREKALAHFPELGELVAEFHAGFDGAFFENSKVKLEVILGDVNSTLPNWTGKADAWFLDGFSPAKNPEAWNFDLIQAVGSHTANGGTVATFSAAGHVRKALSAAGFDVTKRKGFGHKRHMTVANYKA